MNAQKFTQKSLETIQLANNLALENNNMQIEQEHLLYALLKIDQSLIAQLLKKWARTRRHLCRRSNRRLTRCPASPVRDERQEKFISHRMSIWCLPKRKRLRIR